MVYVFIHILRHVEDVSIFTWSVTGLNLSSRRLLGKAKESSLDSCLSQRV